MIPYTKSRVAVNQIGLGQDMWMVPFDNITKVLEVRHRRLERLLEGNRLTKLRFSTSPNCFI